MELTPVHLLLVVIIIIALCVDILTMPVAVGLILSAIAVFSLLGGIRIETMKPAPQADKSPWDDGPAWQNQSILNYPRESIEQQALNTSYTTCYDPVLPVVGSSPSELDGSVDAELTLLSQKRQRDKKVSDGWALKDADYFRHNYSWELDLEERKPWWGNAEY